jgi:uncharacterized low-complexity protein
MMSTTLAKAAAVSGVALIGGLSLSAGVAAAENPFAPNVQGSSTVQLAASGTALGGYRCASNKESSDGSQGSGSDGGMKDGKCGDGKCGGAN